MSTAGRGNRNAICKSDLYSISAGEKFADKKTFLVTAYLHLENHHVKGVSGRIENVSLQDLAGVDDENANRSQKPRLAKQMGLKQILQRHRTC